MKKIAAAGGALAVFILPVLALAAGVSTAQSTYYEGDFPNPGSNGAPVSVTGTGHDYCIFEIQTTTGTDQIVECGSNSSIDYTIDMWPYGGGGSGEYGHYGIIETTDYSFEQTDGTWSGSLSDPNLTGYGDFYYLAGSAPTPAAGHVLFVMPSTTAMTLTVNVGDQLGDAGTVKVVGLVAGVYIVFYVMKQLLSMVQKNRIHERSLEKIEDLNNRHYD